MPLSFLDSKKNIAIWKLEESAEELLSMLDCKEYYYPFINKYKKEHRQQEWLACRVLLKILLGEELLVKYTSDGAPFVEKEDVFISFSHTKNYVAVKKSSVACGIDIEYHSDRVKKIRNKFLSEQENSWIDGMHTVEHLLICWCAKEALFKIIKQNEVDFQKHLHIEEFEYCEKGKLSVYETRTMERRHFILYFEVKSDYIIVYN